MIQPIVTILPSYPAMTEQWPSKSERADNADLLGDIGHQGAEQAQHNMGRSEIRQYHIKQAGV